MVLLCCAGCTDFDALGTQICREKPWVCDAGSPGDSYCQPCAAHVDCGGDGALCVALSFGRVCGRDCSASTCGLNESCQSILVSGAVAGKNCLPTRTLTCDGGVRDGG